MIHLVEQGIAPQETLSFVDHVSFEAMGWEETIERLEEAGRKFRCAEESRTWIS